MSDPTAAGPASSDTAKAKHLCVLIHGLWGNASHLDYIAGSVRARYPGDQLIVYSAKSNGGHLTYDGIEIGAARIASEIEDLLAEYSSGDGDSVKKFSIVGYSLGGLIARFVIGILDHKGYFDRITPVNFVTFASPHLGVRAPLLGYGGQIWNVLGARTVSTSGRQLFMIDDFRQTGKPLLSVLADPESIFIRALGKFQHRCLYANIVNDKSAVFYTTAISKHDPYVQLDKLKLRYVTDFEPVILDPDRPYERLSPRELPGRYERVRLYMQRLLWRIPLYAALSIILPIAAAGFLVNAAIQTVRSRRRIRLHEKDEQGLGAVYSIPFFVQKMRAGLEDAFENVNAAQKQDYLPAGAEEAADVLPSSSSLSSSPLISRQATADSISMEKANGATATTTAAADASANPADDFPTLALTSAQFAMIKSLDEVGFKKFHVYIHKTHHSHAAIIVRMPRSWFEEGKLVIKHWVENEFRL